MSVIRWALLALFVFLSLFTGCSPRQSDVLVLEVGPGKVNLGEYEDFYVRNTGGWEAARNSSMEERERFLDLLTNYRLKLLDAYDRGYMNDPEIQRELKEYHSSLASTFIIEKEVTAPGVRLMYERRSEEIHAQQILIAVAAIASAMDTVDAYFKAMDLIRRAKAGENFDSLVLQYSQDQTAKTSHGDLYYFTGGQMVTDFENAAFALKKGEVTSTPIRTKFGYHIMKILDRRPAPGSIRARHMMTRFQSATADSADSASALRRIQGLQDSLKKGWDFSKLAVKLSEDAGSAQQGGDLGWFERRRWVQPFDEAAFKLQPGQTSDIVRTTFGYHIIRCDSAKPIPTFDAMKDEVKKRYQQYRYNDDYLRYIKRLKDKFQYSFNTVTFDSLVSHLDSTKTIDDSTWAASLAPELRQRNLMSIGQKSYSLDTILSVMAKRPEYHGTSLHKWEVQSKFDRLAESFLIDENTVGLESKHPDFAVLMKEYQDGVVLFKAEQTEVWNKVAVTDTGIRSYYENNKDKFVFPKRVNIGEIHVDTDTLAYMIYDSLMHGGDFAAFAARHNFDTELKNKKGIRGLQPIETDQFTKMADTMSVGQITEPFESEYGGFSIIKVLAKDDPREKIFEEAGAEISNAFQEYESKRLEKEWIERLKQKYPVTKFREQLQKAFTEQKSR